MGWIIRCWESFLERQIMLIENTDPEKITIQEIANFFFLPRFLAKLLFWLGTHEGYFAPNADGTYRYLGYIIFSLIRSSI